MGEDNECLAQSQREIATLERQLGQVLEQRMEQAWATARRLAARLNEGERHPQVTSLDAGPCPCPRGPRASTTGPIWTGRTRSVPDSIAAHTTETQGEARGEETMEAADAARAESPSGSEAVWGHAVIGGDGAARATARPAALPPRRAASPPPQARWLRRFPIRYFPSGVS